MDDDASSSIHQIAKNQYYYLFLDITELSAINTHIYIWEHIMYI
jgi:hypothetical protein